MIDLIEMEIQIGKTRLHVLVKLQDSEIEMYTRALLTHSIH